MTFNRLGSEVGELQQFEGLAKFKVWLPTSNHVVGQLDLNFYGENGPMRVIALGIQIIVLLEVNIILSNHDDGRRRS